MNWNEVITRCWTEFSDQGVLATDAELTICAWNRWLEVHSGRPATDMLGRKLLEEYPKIVGRGLDRYYRGALQGQVQMFSQGLHSYLLPLRVHRGDGPEMMLQSARIMPLLEQERVVGTLTLIEDVTERVRREDALRDSEARYRSLTEDALDSLAVGMFIIDADLRVVWLNRAIERYFGLQRDDLIGQDKRALVHQRIKDIFEDPAQFANKVLATYDDNTYVELFECRVLPGKGREERWLEHRSQPIRYGFYAGGRVEQYYDISERKQAQKAQQEYAERLEDRVRERTRELHEAQEQLVRREKLAVLGQMAGSVGHELRNPLGTISSTVYLLRMLLPDADGDTGQSLDILSEETCRMDKIITDLLDFSRTRKPEREEIALSALVARVLEKQPAPENVRLNTDVPPDLPPVHVDVQQVEMALQNLVSNAYQAMPKGGRLDVAAWLEKGQAVLSISDTGCGMPGEAMKRLFEPLFTTKSQGIGLGLTISRNLVEANGGRIQVQSEEGKGSVFTVLLPLGDADERG